MWGNQSDKIHGLAEAIKFSVQFRVGLDNQD